MNILFIGNSYTYYNDMPAIFQQLARDNGKQVTATAVTRGGRKLIAYKDPYDPTTVQLAEALHTHYDICVLQEQSILPITEFDTFLDGLTLVMDLAKEHADQFILYATWGRKAGSQTLLENGWDTAGMTEMLAQSYEKAAAQLGAKVSHVGKNFLAVSEKMPELELYDPDMTHPSYAGSVLSALTHYHAIFGQFPENTDSLILDRSVIRTFQEIVYKS